MTTPANNIYQFKITLNDSVPTVWRQIQIPDNYSFYDFHCAIQVMMGLSGSHLHEFSMMNLETRELIAIGDLDPDFDDDDVLDGTKTMIKDYFSMKNKKSLYEYDFGDGWEYAIVLEEITKPVPGTKYPKCIAGERAAPPEDCGGIVRYNEIVNIIENLPTASKEDKRKLVEFLKWLEVDHFDPSEFSLDAELQFDR